MTVLRLLEPIVYKHTHVFIPLSVAQLPTSNPLHSIQLMCKSAIHFGVIIIKQSDILIIAYSVLRDLKHTETQCIRVFVLTH